MRILSPLRNSLVSITSAMATPRQGATIYNNHTAKSTTKAQRAQRFVLQKDLCASVPLWCGLDLKLRSELRAGYPQLVARAADVAVGREGQHEEIVRGERAR